MRLFVAVTPGREAIARLSTTIDRLRRHAPSSRWAKVDGLHLTLAFLGERDPADAPKIAAALAAATFAHAPFTLRLRGGGAFGRPGRPRVLWVGCEGDTGAFEALYRDVAAALAPLGYAPDRDTFTPHLTLCRAREQGGDRELARCAELLRDEDFGEVRASEVELYESKLSPAGAAYTVVSRAALVGDATPSPS